MQHHTTMQITKAVSALGKASLYSVILNKTSVNALQLITDGDIT
jgi:hypothetical protein